MPLSPVVAAVVAAADKGAPLGVKDLLRFAAGDVRCAFDSGAIMKSKLRRGGQDLVIILPAPPPDDDGAWSPDELAYVEMAYTAGVTFGEMSRALGRTGGQILQQAWRMKIERGRDGWETHVPAWRARRLRSLIEEARLRGADPDDAGDGLDHRALRRAFAAGRADVTGRERHGRPWREADVAHLQQLLEQGSTIAEMTRALRRRYAAVTSKISALGWCRLKRWSEDEDRILVAALESGKSAAETATFLPGRSELACKLRGMKLVPGRGFDAWDDDEIHALRIAVEGGENLRDFAAGIGRTVGGVRWKCRHLGLVHPARVRPYSAREDRRIVDGWKRREAPQEIAADLGRPIAGVYNRAFKLGITGKGPGHYHRAVRAFEVAYVRRRVAEGWTARQIADRLRRSHHMVYQIARRNGIRFPRCGPRKRPDSGRAA